jgi:hypothetical protein
MAVVYLHPEKNPKNIVEGSGADVDAFPMGKPTKIGAKPFDAVDKGSEEPVAQATSNNLEF